MRIYNINKCDLFTLISFVIIGVILALLLITPVVLIAAGLIYSLYNITYNVFLISGCCCISIIFIGIIFLFGLFNFDTFSNLIGFLLSFIIRPYYFEINDDILLIKRLFNSYKFPLREINISYKKGFIDKIIIEYDKKYIFLGVKDKIPTFIEQHNINIEYI